MADFAPAVERVLDHEVGGAPSGGYVNHPDDPGGETKWGISKRAYPDVDVKALTREAAVEIYRRDFWNELRLGEVRDQRVAEKVLDVGVNLGTHRAGKFVQRALRLAGIVVKVDGIVGPKTLEALNRCLGDWFRVCLGFYQLNWYARLVASDLTRYNAFLEGWRRRANFHVTR